MSVGDFNGDGVQDLAVLDSGSNSLNVMLGNGSGGFTAGSGSPIAVGVGPVSAVVGDFNGDGIEDIAIANSGANNVTVMLGGKARTTATLSTTWPFTFAVPQPIPLVVTVSDTTGGFATPTGTVTFSDGATVLGTATQSQSPYTFSAANLTPGNHTFTASYSGDARIFRFCQQRPHAATRSPRADDFIWTSDRRHFRRRSLYGDCSSQLGTCGEFRFR